MKDLSPIAGIHSVRAALKFGNAGVAEIWLERSRHDRRLTEVTALARQTEVNIRHMERAELDTAAAGANHQGVLAWVRVPAARSEQDLTALLNRLEQPPFLLLLDEITDPHNLGACLRTAEAVGVHAVIAPRDNAVGLTPVVCKVASGAAETLPYFQVTNLVRVMEDLKARGVWLTGTAGEAEFELYDVDFRGAIGLVMGSEGSGLRRLTREHCDRLVRLPMCGQVESLNVSVAAGVCLYEALRQRRAR
ncbi:23S rRNA (guanosine(2251)-2'-O)-methyltransferase RlmB [Chromatium weissei]|nr:23S rRNA (guanosine(2251)-2'-O)-methyltransferase RlmB [Chromatium weissei]